jgi:amino acid transporter
MGNPLLATKPLNVIMAEAAEEHEHSLKRALGPINLITLGIGAIIGAGIFVLTGQAAAQSAGPAIVVSFILSGIICAFAGLCYAEFASLIPIAGSAYTYGYATLGEIFAWIIGWDLILEYAFGAATVASAFTSIPNGSRLPERSWFSTKATGARSCRCSRCSLQPACTRPRYRMPPAYSTWSRFWESPQPPSY